MARVSVFLSFWFITIATTRSSGINLNDRPIIGVLTQEYYGKLLNGKTYIAASYVKYLEAAGARVVPIFVNRSVQYYSQVVKYTNGILFPGGGQYFNRSDSGYGNAGRILYKLAVQLNDQGDYYPIWGTCLGFELLTYLSSGSQWWLTNCNSEDEALPLEFVPGVKSSRILSSLPDDVKTDLATMNVTVNYHNQCITPKDFIKSGLDKFYRVLSTNHDSKNVKFVSTMEGIAYPFYGTAWHPEKNSFEFSLKKKNIPHSYEAVRVAQHFANFFVNEARQNSHHFPSEKQEQEALIYNYNPVYTSPSGSGFAQCYFFD